MTSLATIDFQPKEKKVYHTNLNPINNNGLNHQLFGIVDGLMIANFCNRDLCHNEFSPDYNLSLKIPLRDVIDVDYLNLMLKKMGFVSQIIPYDRGQTWVETKYTNPVYRREFLQFRGAERFHRMIEALLQEENHYMYLYTSFVFPIPEAFGNDIPLTNMAVSISKLLIPSPKMQKLVDARKELLELGDSYHCIHLRLEDDWVIHLTEKLETSIHRGKTREGFSREIFDSIVKIIREKFNDGKKIFVATGLGKSENVNDYLLEELFKLFPERIAVVYGKACIWDEHYPGIGPARELEGFIDFSICQQAESAILASYSSFSISLRMSFNYDLKPNFSYAA